MLINQECEYHRPGDAKPLRAVVVVARAANKYDLVVEGFKLQAHQRGTHQYVEFGNGPGKCCPIGWEPTREYAVTTTAGELAATPLTTAAKRWRPPQWPANVALIGALVSLALHVWALLGGP